MCRSAVSRLHDSPPGPQKNMFAHLACVKTLRLKFVRLSILLGSLPAASIESNASRGSGTPATLADKRELVWDSRVLIGASLHWDTPSVRQELLDSRRNTGKRFRSPDCATPGTISQPLHSVPRHFLTLLFGTVYRFSALREPSELVGLLGCRRYSRYRSKYGFVLMFFEGSSHRRQTDANNC